MVRRRATCAVAFPVVSSCCLPSVAYQCSRISRCRFNKGLYIAAPDPQNNAPHLGFFSVKAWHLDRYRYTIRMHTKYKRFTE